MQQQLHRPIYAGAIPPRRRIWDVRRSVGPSDAVGRRLWFRLANFRNRLSFLGMSAGRSFSFISLLPFSYLFPFLPPFIMSCGGVICKMR